MPGTPALDAVVVGAGVAGLGAARELSRAGCRVAVVEARPRIGGRVLTLHDPEWPLPVEMGAEFVHGEAARVRTACDEARLSVEELPDVHVASDARGWRVLGDFYGQVESVLAGAGRRRRDVSFADHLRSRPSLSPARRALARLFVEGYHAAPAARVSARWLADGAAGDEESNRQHRLPHGYGALARWLAAALDPDRVRVHLNAVAGRVEWRPGFARVHGRSVTGRALEPLDAPALIVTVPVGVLKAPGGAPGAIAFNPPLSAKTAALGRLEMGHARKLALRFRDRFWDDPHFVARRLGRRRGARRPVNFWHDGRLDFPTWWTAAPRHAPVLTAWAGGPRAEVLARSGEGELVGRALEALAGLMRVPRSWVEPRLESWASHDWTADPYARGSYSHPLVGGEHASAVLARPIEGTLFFAGEATQPDETGTVEGALASGWRAARQVMERQRPKRR
jgi:monoamine oxidase